MHSAESTSLNLPDVWVVAGGVHPQWLGSAFRTGVRTVRLLTGAQTLEEICSGQSADVVVFEDLEPDLLERCCESARDIPGRPALLVVSNKEQTQARAFQEGADDCISSTTNPTEVLDRVLVNALRARAGRGSAASNRVLRTSAGNLAVIVGSYVAFNGSPLDLPRIQSRILRMLMDAANPLSVKALASGVWPGELVADHTVHTQIALLRTRLAGFGIKIDHLRRIGYVLAADHVEP
jgi:DNA-binding response OmpR family regulator